MTTTKTSLLFLAENTYERKLTKVASLLTKIFPSPPKNHQNSAVLKAKGQVAFEPFSCNERQLNCFNRFFLFHAHGGSWRDNNYFEFCHSFLACDQKEGGEVETKLQVPGLCDSSCFGMEKVVTESRR